MVRAKVEIRYNPDWTVWFEYQHGKDTITPGTQLKFKYIRGIYKFEKYVINSRTKTDWIDVTGPDGYRSFPTENLKGVVKPKIRRQNKNV